MIENQSYDYNCEIKGILLKTIKRDNYDLNTFFIKQ